MKCLKNLSSILCTSLMMIFAFSAISCSNNDDDNMSGIFKFSSNNVEVAIGATNTVSVSGGTTPYTVTPGDTKIATATVSDNTITITGVKEGTTLLTVTDKNKNSGKLFITVKKATTGMTFDKTSLSIDNGKEDVVTITGGTAPYTATVKDAAIASATINDNKITIKGLKAGSTTVTIADKDKKNSGSITVTIK